MKLFTVLSEFKFDVAQPLTGMDQLQGKVDALSGSVNNAMHSVKSLGIGFMGEFSGASTGILGLIGSAIHASDKFSDSQISLTQIIDSNMEHLTGTIGTLNEKLNVSAKIMKDISEDAVTFGIPANDLLQMTKGLSAMLVPKGLAGDNFSAARTMSRNMLKSAPNLGIQPVEVQGQLLRAIEGSASMGDTLFRRLISEAPEAFKANKVTDAKMFNALDAAKRFEILNTALGKFAGNSHLLEARANTLSGTIQRLRDLFSSFASILKPLGDAIIPPLVQIMNYAIIWLNTQGREIVKMMANFIGPLIEKPKEFIINMQQLSKLSRDVSIAAGFVGFIVTIKHLSELAAAMSTLPVLGPVLGIFDKIIKHVLNFPIIGGILKGFMGIFSGHATTFLGLIRLIGLTMLRMAGAFAFILIPLQGLTRAISRMKLDTLEWVANNMAFFLGKITSLKDSLAIFFAPIQMIIDGFEELFYAILGGSFLLESFKGVFGSVVDGIGAVADTFLNLYAAFRGLIAGMFDVIFRAFDGIATVIGNMLEGNILNAFKGTKNIFAGYMEAGSDEFQKTLDKYRRPNMDGELDNSKISNVVQYNTISMNNSFKEVLQPDRIAWTIKDQIEKAGRNRTTASLSGSTAKQSRSM